MLAAVFDGTTIRVTDRPEPVRQAGEARIRTTLVGICNTDLEILKGYASFAGILGHEFVGIVDAAEDAALVGRRVVGEINVSCGECEMCRLGRGEHCLRRQAVGIRGHDGALAEYLCLPERNLHPVPDCVPDEAAVFVEPLAAACRVLEQVPAGPGSRVVVLGDGKLGSLVAQVIANAGAEVTAVGRHPDKLAFLAGRGIATHLGVPQPGMRADLVVECTGRPEGYAAALEIVRPAGTVVLKSTYHGRVPADLSRLVVDEIAVVGSRCGPFATALRLLETGRVEVAPLISARYALADAPAALEHAARRGVLKVVVDTAGPALHGGGAAA